MGGLTGNRLTTKYFSPSISYYEDSLTWCVARARPIPQWQNVICLMKDREIWGIITLIFYVTVYTFYILTKYEDRVFNSYTIMLSGLYLMLNAPTPYPVKTLAARLLFIIVCVTCEMIIIMIDAFMFNIQISVIYRIQADNLKTLLNDFELVGDRAAFSLIMQQEEVIQLT